MENSKIEWTHHTFNPWIGCNKISAGCKFCYAEAQNKRWKKGNWGPDSTRVRTSSANWNKPYNWNIEAAKNGTRYRVFCASMADVFEDYEGLDEIRKDLFIMINSTPHLDWLLLTKRPENIMKMIPDGTYGLSDWTAGFPSNVWIGTSVEDQEGANARIPHLLQVPASIRFLSCEPLLGPVDLTNNVFTDSLGVSIQGFLPRKQEPDDYKWSVTANGIHMVIVGGESGPNARPMHPDWARSLRDQCKTAGVAFFFKQWGEWVQKEKFTDSDGAQYYTGFIDGDHRLLKAKKGHLKEYRFNGKMDLIDAVCDVKHTPMLKVGKKIAGRLLDGVIIQEFPNKKYSI